MTRLEVIEAFKKAEGQKHIDAERVKIMVEGYSKITDEHWAEWQSLKKDDLIICRCGNNWGFGKEAILMRVGEWHGGGPRHDYWIKGDEMIAYVKNPSSPQQWRVYTDVWNFVRRATSEDGLEAARKDDGCVVLRLSEASRKILKAWSEHVAIVPDNLVDWLIMESFRKCGRDFQKLYEFSMSPEALEMHRKVQAQFDEIDKNLPPTSKSFQDFIDSELSDLEKE